jgi:hypothetical protein
MMKKHWLLSVVLVACLAFLSACNLPQESVKEQDTPETAGEETVTLKVLEESACYLGPGADFTLVRVLEPNQTFPIISIDTEGAWYQVNPNELVDPNPPDKPRSDDMSLRCWVPSDAGQTSGEQATIPIAPLPILQTAAKTTCYAGPSTSFDAVSSLDVGQYFKIYAIDDDITWIDDDITWIIDGADWFQVNPNELVDPNPPDKPLIAGLSLTEEELSLRCWVPGTGVHYTGDLLMIPVVSIPDEAAVVKLLEKTSCYFGPGMSFGVARVLEADRAFHIAHVAADGAWYQVNPNELVDPNPPDKPRSDDMSLRCWIPSGTGQTSGDLGKAPIFDRPLLRLGEQTNCYAGPGMEYQSLRLLDTGQYFRIFAIDDDITWIDDDITWIDDDMTWIADGASWFQINPNELVDPNPPDKPLMAGLTLTEEELSFRCWVPRRSVQYTGDLFSLPVLSVPVVTPTPMPTATLKPIIYPTATPYPPTATPTPGDNCSIYTTEKDCRAHHNDGCDWDPNEQVCYQSP